MKKNYISNKGFTIVELILVVALVGILSAILVSTINVGRQRDYANDGVRRQNLMDLVQALETYSASERSYPDEGGVNNPLDVSATDNVLAAFYVEAWPSGYVYNEDGSDFSIHILMGSSTNYFKYSSVWQEIRDCTPAAINTVGSCTTP